MELFLYPTITLVFPQNKVLFIFIFFYFFCMGPWVPYPETKKDQIVSYPVSLVCRLFCRSPLGPLQHRGSGGCSPPMLLHSYVKYLYVIEALALLCLP